MLPAKPISPNSLENSVLRSQLPFVFSYKERSCQPRPSGRRMNRGEGMHEELSPREGEVEEEGEEESEDKLWSGRR
jgi:hypothetical protein